MARRRPRELKAEEEALWDRIAKTTRRMHPTPKASAPKIEPIPKNKSQERFKIEAFEVGSRTANGNPAFIIQEKRNPPSLNMDRGQYQRMKRGKSKPEARIDLHGMTANDAYSELIGFLFEAQASGKRLVLVITGKGRPGTDDGPIPNRMGVLRRSLPEWLSRPPLNGIVQQYAEAHQRHGGSGAFYVYLRRLR